MDNTVALAEVVAMLFEVPWPLLNFVKATSIPACFSFPPSGLYLLRCGHINYASMETDNLVEHFVSGAMGWIASSAIRPLCSLFVAMVMN